MMDLPLPVQAVRLKYAVYRMDRPFVRISYRQLVETSSECSKHIQYIDEITVEMISDMRPQRQRSVNGRRHVQSDYML